MYNNSHVHGAQDAMVEHGAQEPMVEPVQYTMCTHSIFFCLHREILHY